MKFFIKKLLAQLAKNNFTWQLLKPLVTLGVFLAETRNNKEKENTLTLKNSLIDFSKKEVLHGPFKGLKYPSLNSVGSALYPKLIGCYERELHEIIELICKKRYSEIIDIGCAEGYYATGLCMRIPKSKVYAFDTNAQARELCLQMAILNGVGNRVEISSTCTSEKLKKFHFTNRGLVICDCEGAELSIFNLTNVDNLSKCDLLIETHDFININISTYLCGLFSKTHNITVVKSIDDIEKAKKYFYTETEHLDFISKKKLYSERRPSIMEWLFCESKGNSNLARASHRR